MLPQKSEEPSSGVDPFSRRQLWDRWFHRLNFTWKGFSGARYMGIYGIYIYMYIYICLYMVLLWIIYENLWEYLGYYGILWEYTIQTCFIFHNIQLIFPVILSQGWRQIPYLLSSTHYSQIPYIPIEILVISLLSLYIITGWCFGTFGTFVIWKCSIYWECHPSHCLIFFRGVGLNHQAVALMRPWCHGWNDSPPRLHSSIGARISEPCFQMWTSQASLCVHFHPHWLVK